jgi:aspartyl-tRNA(Asn)/glutamyl-tRNA(Gln) amidotransferase subunit A
LNVFATVDLLVTPSVAGPPSTIEPLTQHADLDPGRTRNLWPFAVYGLPAMSVPCGFTAAGLPVGLQIVGAPFAEGTVLALAHAYEQATEWHKRRPALNAQVSIGRLQTNGGPTLHAADSAPVIGP